MAAEPTAQPSNDGAPAPEPAAKRWRSNAWTDLALVVPIFLAYHLGVILLDVRNAADLVTAQLTALADRHIAIYWGITLLIGLVMTTVLWVLGRGQAFEKKRFMLVGAEGVLYAIIMRTVAAYVVGSLSLVPADPTQFGPALADPALGTGTDGVWAGVVMSLGAGLYEEIAFRVGLFGVGTLVIRLFWGGIMKMGAYAIWALITALIFSGWHYVGAYGDDFVLASFVFRAVCGLVLTAIYLFRGFAPAVWTHALYDVWAIALH